jgi:hypothetical protein
VIFILVVDRFRLAFNAYISNINKMDGDMKVTLGDSKSWSTMRLIQAGLASAAFLSILSFGYVLWSWAQGICMLAHTRIGCHIRARPRNEPSLGTNAISTK